MAEGEDASLKVNKEEGGGEKENLHMEKSRKEKRKEKKKMKRKQLRKEAAEKEREAEEARLNDPEEQKRIAREVEEEKKRQENALKEFQERERAWLEAMAMKRKAQEDEDQNVKQEEEKEEEENERNIDDASSDEIDSEEYYVEEGPAEIIWQGNEIIVRKKKVRVPKKENPNPKTKEEDDNRPTSNPLPPQSEAFSDYLNASSAQEVLESVAKQVPNFGTEQDKAHCPFHLKTGACRFGQRCSRVHFYPDKSCTLLIKNMYNGPGLAWEQDEGLEFTDEEVERAYEEFYEDVHTEFLKFGEIVNFKVCKNGSFHLRGNVYVHYKLLESAVLAYQSINGRYFAGKQVKCEFVNITRWKVAICGEFMKSRFKTCSHGTACNFIHCFRNPGGDYEWADWDKLPPRYWVKRMAALFGYDDEAGFEKEIEHEHSGHSRYPSRIVKSDAERHGSRRTKSREMTHMIGDAERSRYNKADVQESSHSQRGKSSDRKRTKVLDGRSDRQSTRVKWDRDSERIYDNSSDGGCSDSQMGQNSDRKRTKMSDGRSHLQNNHDSSSDGGYSEIDIGGARDSDQVRYHYDAKKNSKKWSESSEYLDDHRNIENRVFEDTENLHGETKKRTRRRSEGNNEDTDIRNYKDKGDQLDRDRDSKRHRSHVHRSPRHHIYYKEEEVSGLLDDHDRYRHHDSDSSDHGSEKNNGRHHGHQRKHSRHSVDCSELPDSLGHKAKKLKRKEDRERYRHSTHRYEETDSSEDYERKHTHRYEETDSSEDDHKWRHHVKRRSHSHKRHNKK